MDPVTHARNARERFDIEMHQVARMRPLVASDGRWRGEPRQAIQPGSDQDDRDGRARDLELDRDRPGGSPRIASRQDLGHHGGSRPPRLMMGRRSPILEGSGAAGAVTG
jgi:hypothetical protein